MKHLHQLLASQFQTRVLIVQPSTQRQISSSRGHSSGGINLRREYGGSGFKADVLEEPTLKSLAAALSDTKPQVLHLCGSMARSTSSGINLDFGAQVQFSLSAFSKILEQASFEHEIRPLLILDVPRPTVLGETITQLLLRNAFAATLMRMANPIAILATGLVTPNRQQADFTRILLNSLHEGLPLGELADRLRNMPRQTLGWPMVESLGTDLNLSALIGPLGTTLFTQDPSALIL